MNKVLKNIIPVVLVSLLFLMIGLTIYNEKKEKSKEYDYDISFANVVTPSDVIDMFKSNKTYVVMFGRKSCAVCAHMLPALKEAQTKNNYITQYVDMDEVDLEEDDWINLSNKYLTMKSKQKISEDGSGDKEEENTYGYFLTEYGMTPTIVIIKEGKQIAGVIGGADKDKFVNWIGKKLS